MELIFGEVIKTTDKAVLFRLDDTGKEKWIPRSQIDDGEDVEVGAMELYIAKWLVEKLCDD
jgi:hypothetical protein